MTGPQTDQPERKLCTYCKTYLVPSRHGTWKAIAGHCWCPATSPTAPHQPEGTA